MPEKKGGTAMITWFTAMIMWSAAPPSCLAVYRPSGMEMTSMIKKAMSVRVRVMGILSPTREETGVP